MVVINDENSSDLEKGAGFKGNSLDPKSVTSLRASAEPVHIKGLINYSLKDQYAFVCWKKVLEEVFQQFGFSPVQLRPFELRQHLEAKGGIGKQIFGVYRMDGNQMTELGLPFDHTLPLALYIAQKHEEIPFPFKRQHIGVVYRGENPQAGRFRAFHQADVDIIGQNLELTADAECLAALITSLTKLNIGQFTTFVNHIGIVHGILDAFSIADNLRSDILRELDKFDKLSKEEVLSNLKKILIDETEEKILKLLQVFSFRGDINQFPIDGKSARVKQSFEKLLEVVNTLAAFGVDTKNVKLAPNIVRGLDYYTGIVFETFLDGKEQYGSIMSGGRYDKLVEAFKPDVNIEGVGGSIGLTRLFDILSRSGNISGQRISTSDVFVGYRTIEQKILAMQAATKLRDAGLRVTFFTNNNKIKKQLEYASKLVIPIALLVMESESFVVKDMTKQEHDRGKDFSSQLDAIDCVLQLMH